MATANRDFQGVNSDWGDTANWSGATVPISGVDARLGGTSQSLDTRLNQNAVALEDLFIAETYTGNLGGSGNVLEIDCTGVLTAKPGGNQCYIKGDFPEVHASPMKHTANAFVIETKSGGDINRLFGERGRTTIVAGSDVDDIWMLPGATDAVLIIQAGTTVNNDIHIASGTIELSGECNGIIYVSGNGRLVVKEGADVNRIFQKGGTVVWQNGDFTFDSSGLPTILVEGGFFDAHLLKNTHTVPEFWVVGSAGSVNLRSGQQNIIRTRSKSIGATNITLDDGDTF